ncbi:hypothetical protein S245_003063, partial [Arachis hypogaea]
QLILVFARTQKGAKAPITSFKTPCHCIPSLHQLQLLHPSSSWIYLSCRIAPARERKVERHVRCSSLCCARPGVVAWLPNRPGVIVLNLPPMPCCVPHERTFSPLPGSLFLPFPVVPISSFVFILLFHFNHFAC